MDDRARARPVGGVKRSLTAVKQIMVRVVRKISNTPHQEAKWTTGREPAPLEALSEAELP